ncbi:MAG: hypothetical protein Q4F95_00730 [Oscillospiraceae bacterium]|nr:hypothetical protein [Oscillospiraceae bacterium]
MQAKEAVQQFIVNDDDKVVHFNNWDFAFPKVPDYEYFQNEEKLIVEYKGKRIVCFSFPFDRLNVEATDCLLSFGNQNVHLKAKKDLLHSIF